MLKKIASMNVDDYRKTLRSTATGAAIGTILAGPLPGIAVGLIVNDSRYNLSKSEKKEILERLNDKKIM